MVQSFEELLTLASHSAYGPLLYMFYEVSKNHEFCGWVGCRILCVPIRYNSGLCLNLIWSIYF